ncbi:hypothetical protein MRX96_036186 [Rhipicephalus microplus]
MFVVDSVIPVAILCRGERTPKNCAMPATITSRRIPARTLRNFSRKSFSKERSFKKPCEGFRGTWVLGCSELPRIAAGAQVKYCSTCLIIDAMSDVGTRRR